MIAQANAVEIFNINIDRTNKLLEAADKIKAYNWIYQKRVAAEDPQFLQTVNQVQNTQLERLIQTCAEHAIISIATVVETYCSELLQELLSNKPNYFRKQINNYTDKINDLLSDSQTYTYEDIEKKLGIRGRKDYYHFYPSFNIPFITSDTERQLIEYIFIQRNHFVHNANRPDSKKNQQLRKINTPLQDKSLLTEARRLRTHTTKLINKIDMRVKAKLYK